MKRYTIQLLSLILSLLIALCSSPVLAQETQPQEEVPLYEFYGYQEDFVYEDEIIGHALKSTVVYISHEYFTSAYYTPWRVDTAWVEELIELNPYVSDAMILDYIIEHREDYFFRGSTKSVEVSFGSRGSGVVIGEDGYIATNAHVVESLSTEDISIYTVNNIADSISDDCAKLQSDLEALGLYASMGDLWVFEDLMYDSVEFEDADETFYIAVASSSGETDVGESRLYEAEVLEYGVPVSSDSPDGLTQDVAILKIDEENLVALALSETYPEVNSNIVSGGFPAVANEIFDQIGEESILSATIGTGKVARHIPIKGTRYKAMEITTTISQGSSGGPSVDNHLHIEGLNTYGNSSDKRFAYMVPSEAILDLSESYPIEQGETTLTFLTGLQMMQQGYGEAALECFREVKSMRSSLPYIDNLIQLASAMPQTSPVQITEEPTPTIDWQTIIFVSVIAGLLIVIIVLLIILIRRNKKKVKPADVSNAVPVHTIPQNTPQFVEPVAVTTEEPISEPVVQSNLCPNCGAVLDDGPQNFCQDCGYHLGKIQ